MLIVGVTRKGRGMIQIFIVCVVMLDVKVVLCCCRNVFFRRLAFVLCAYQYCFMGDYVLLFLLTFVCT